MKSRLAGRRRVAALLPMVCLAVSAALAQSPPVYRCGPDGRAYSQTPCPGGRAVAVGDERTQAQRIDAREQAQAEARHARAMERERMRHEQPRLYARAGAIGLPGRPTDQATTADSGAQPKRRHRRAGSRPRSPHKPVFKAVAPPAAKPSP